MTANGLCIVGEGSALGPRLALSVESTVTLESGHKRALCEYMHPSCLNHVLYHRPGYGQGLVRTSTVGGITEATMVKFGPYGLVKMVIGKCIAVKLAFPMIVSSPLAAGGLVLGYDYWYRQWKNNLYKPEDLWMRLGYNIGV